MKRASNNPNQPSFLLPSLAEQLDSRQPLYRLANEIPWETFESAYEELYSQTGRPAKPIRMMVGLLLLKHLENLSDEVLVDRWTQNPYYQFFCGMTEFQWNWPCDPTDLVYFRKRIGATGMGLILAVSAQIHGNRAESSDVVIDSTVQEKNITFPTDTKLYLRIIKRCWRLADGNSVGLRRRYGKEVKKSLLAIRFMKRRGGRKAGLKGQRKLRTIAGRLVRELERKLSPEVVESERKNFALYHRVLGQKRNDSGKIYSLHEPEVYCISKGKDHKKYEFGCKSSIAITKDTGVIVGAVSHEKNIHDSRTLDEILDQIELFVDQRPELAITDRGYRGRKKVLETAILIPAARHTEQTQEQTDRLRCLFRRRSSVEAVIGHLKQDHRLIRNYLKGTIGDTINLILASAAWNLSKWMRENPAK